jgi:transcriptional regulator with XRE-family HTH domain
MSRNLTLPEQMSLMFAYGESRGISAAYRTIAIATGQNGNNIRKIPRVENVNPGLRILRALTDYFQVDLAYFNCQARPACKHYLGGFNRQRLIQNMEMGLKGPSEESQEFLRTAFVYARKAEGLPPVD